MKTFLPLVALLAFTGCASEEAAPAEEMAPPAVEETIEPMMEEPMMDDSTMTTDPMMEADPMTDTTTVM